MSICSENETLTAERRRKQEEISKRYHQIAPGTPAEEDLVEQHLPLVRTVVGRLAMTLPSHVDADDLYSAGLVGLLNAVRNYNPQGGSTFESYARVRIRGSILDELRRLDWVPRSVHEKAAKVQTAIQQLEQAAGRIPTNIEVAKALGLSLDEYEELLDEVKPAAYVCLDAVQTDTDEGDRSRYETIADASQPDPVETASRRELAQLVAERLELLPQVQRQVLALYYFENLRLREIAEAFGVTESRICQIHAQAILAIRALIQRHESTGV